MKEGPPLQRQPETKASSSQGSPWEAVQRAYEDFERRAHAGLDASRMRAGDVLRPAIEAVVAVPRAVSVVLRTALDSSTKRVEDAAKRVETASQQAQQQAEALQRTWESGRQAAETQRKADAATAEADRAKAKREAIEAVRAGWKEVAAVEGRTRYLKAFAMTAPAAVLMFALGMATENWRGSAATTRDAAEKLTRLSEAANSASQELTSTRTALAEASKEMQEAVATAATGLNVLRALGTLPATELETAQKIIAEMAAAARPNGASPYLQVLRETMAIAPARRRDALEFAQIEDPGLRANILEMAKWAAAREFKGWFPGEAPYKGCLANGPNLPTDRNTVLRTCLVRLPDGWTAQPDTGLRQFYRNGG